jgi:hypothetical protein
MRTQYYLEAMLGSQRREGNPLTVVEPVQETVAVHHDADWISVSYFREPEEVRNLSRFLLDA